MPPSSHTHPYADSDPLLADLTAPQREAVLTTEGPLLILAGPGSGKTRVITRRIAHLLRMGVPGWQVLAVTFTNKAAAEMRERVLHLLAPEAEHDADRSPQAQRERWDRAARGLTVTTFHALCARVLRRHADEAGVAGLTSTYSIYDGADQTALMKRVIADVGLSTSNWPPGSMLGQISAAKNRLQDAAAYAAQAHDFHSRTVAKVYTAYEQALRAANAVDFDDLLGLTVRLLRTNRAVADRLRDRWQYLMIDEYQDTNHAQFALATLLAARREVAGDMVEPNICVVGDPDQAIYGWRGADIANILDFEKQYPGARVITLGENFRSTAPILKAADALIRRNQRRKHKDLYTARTDAGAERPMIVLCRDERHEAEVVVDWLKAQRESGTAWREMAVFYRTNSLSRVIEDALRQAAAPYVIARGTAFYEREEVKDALAYLRVVVNQRDDVSLLRIVNKPARGVGPATIEHCRALAASSRLCLLDALREAAAHAATPRLPEISQRAGNAIAAFLRTFDGWSAGGTFLGADVPASLSSLVERVIRESGLEASYGPRKGAEQTDDDRERLDNLGELVSSAHEFEQEFVPESDPAADAPREGATVAAPPLLGMLRAYLESVSLVADADRVDPASGAVTLMTLHAAKGLEFRAVAMVGVEEGLMPHARSLNSDAEHEEERRLCFVGVTRARERLLLTAARYRTVRGVTERAIPSHFLDELAASGAVARSDQSEAWGDDGDDAPPRAPGSWSPPAIGRADRSATSGAGAAYPVGCMVRHPQFGVGRVAAVMGGSGPRADDARARVEFRDVGAKTLILRYARLERIS